MTKKIFLILTALLYLAPVSGQDLNVEASYWDENNALYKIEQKYSGNNNSVLYVRHTDDNSICVKKQEFMRRDTFIVQMDHCEINQEKTKLENFSESDIQTVSSSKDKDTATISFYKEHIFVGDTIFTGSAARTTYEFVNKVKKGRLPMILNGEIKINPNATAIDETVRTYYVNNHPVKVEVINSDKVIFSTSYFTFFRNGMVCKEYQENNSREKVLSVDSLTWNKDTTEIMWYTIRKEVNKKYLTKYVISKNKLKLYMNEALQKEITFVNDHNLFHKLVASNLIYNDPRYSCELYQFEIKKIAKITLPDDQERIMEYMYDKQKRVTEQKQFDENKKFKRIAYRYN